MDPVGGRHARRADLHAQAAGDRVPPPSALNAFIEDIEVIPATSGGVDQIYMIVRRTINGSTMRYVEQLGDRFFEPEDPDAPTALGAWFLDCALYYEGAPIKTLTSLIHLEGQEVGVFADGAMQSRKTVSGGTIVLDRAASKILVGIPVTARIKDLPRNVNAHLRSQRAVWASNNLDPAYGAPAVIAGRTAMRVESDLELARAGTEIEKADALTKVANIRGAAVSSAGGALSASMRAEAANEAAFYGAGTALLSGLSRTRWFNTGAQSTATG
jgi:hypothetical protein